MSGRARDSWIACGIAKENIHECRTPGEDNPNKGKTSLALQGEKASRIKCQQEAAAIIPQPEYVIMADPDRACLDSNNDYRLMDTNVADGEKFLDDNNDFGAIALTYPSKGRKEDDENLHIDIGFVIYRYEVFAKLKFELATGETCYCPAVTREIWAMGKRFGYLDSLNRIMHV